MRPPGSSGANSGVLVPPARTDVVATVLDALEASLGDGDEPAALAMLWSARRADLSGHLLTLPDKVPVGTGTPRLTVAASAVYVALKLLGDTPTARGVVRQGELVAALSEFFEISTGKISAYNCELIEAVEDRHGAADPSAILEDDGAAAD